MDRIGHPFSFGKSNLDSVLSRLKSVRRTRSGWQACCPAHDDRRPSLSLTQAPDGTLLLKCHAGCPTERIVAALGLDLRDLFPNRGSTMNDKQMSHSDVKTFRDPEQAVEALTRKFGRPPDHRWTYRNAQGQPVGFVLRWETEQGKEIRPIARQADGQWTIGAMPPPRPLYRLPELLAAQVERSVWVVEGEKCADAAVSLGLLATTSAGGAQAADKTDWSPLRDRLVVILPDHDDAGRRYAEQVAKLCLSVGAASVRILDLAQHLPDLPAGGDLADLVASPDHYGLPTDEPHGPAELAASLYLLAQNTPLWQPEQRQSEETQTSGEANPSPSSGKARVLITPAEHEAVQAAAAALAADPNLYVRAGRLVTVRSADDLGNDFVRRSPGAPTIRLVPPAVLRTRLTALCDFLSVTERSGERIERPVHPPGWLVNAVHDNEAWPGLRRLRGITEHPVFLKDGSILATAGYDPRSELYLHLPADLRLSVPEYPTRQDVAAAVERLEDVVCDFPFARPEHKAAYFAGLLSSLARWCYAGPTPLFLIDANVRAAGKGLLAHLAGRILIGRELPVSSYTQDAEELRKIITAVAIQGDSLVLFDNLSGPVGNAVLDAALTATRWHGRILGESRTYDGPLDTVFWATGNNVMLRADLSRRVVHVRLESPLERPEEREGFRHPDLLGYVERQRGELLSALLTILRAWHVAGRPRHGLRPWGSFEGWSGVVREALVFAGLPDPGVTREELQATADLETEALRDLLQGMTQLDPDGRGLTAADLVAAAKGVGCAPDLAATLKAAIEQLVGRLDAKALGYRLQAYKRRNVGGLMLVPVSGGHKGAATRWTVRPVEAVSRETISPSPQADSGVVRGDGEMGEMVPPGEKIDPASGGLGVGVEEDDVLLI
jgi:hypothetical protein